MFSSARYDTSLLDHNKMEKDFLYLHLADLVDKQSSMRYTGKEMEFPPFLAKEIPGYKGCYEPKDLAQQNARIFEWTPRCVSSWRAMMNGKQSFCSIANEVNLPNINSLVYNKHPGEQPKSGIIDGYYVLSLIGIVCMILAFFSRKKQSGEKFLAMAPYETTASRQPSTKSGYLKLKVIFLRALALILIAPISLVASEDINLDCRGDVSFTSPNYPSNYLNNANKKWSITAPKGRRILVTFNDFNIERDDTLYLSDLVDKQSSKPYTGEMKFHPFLAKGNEMKMTFISLRSGKRRGFNVSASCYDHSRYPIVPRIVGGNSPGKGFLELRTPSDDWRRVHVCNDSFGGRVAEVICGELGYPAVRQVSYMYGTDDCMSAEQDCIMAPICDDYAFRLEDCSWSSGNCSSANAVKVECYEPAYKGCYNPEDLPQQKGVIFESTSQCVSSCRANKGEALAIMNGKQCFCSTADKVNLPNITPVSTCIPNPQDTKQRNYSLVYDVSFGFCNELDDVINGSLDSNITWFGSIVHCTCDDGYSLNGSGTLQCVPGLSPYYPAWNGSLPTCDMLEEHPKRNSNYLYFLFLLIAIPIIANIWVLWKKFSRRIVRVQTEAENCSSSMENGEEIWKPSQLSQLSTVTVHKGKKVCKVM